MLIQVISSTTREGRFSERTARWVVQSLRSREHFDVELIDLRENPLPFFDAPPPAKAPRDYATAEVARLGRALDRADGFIVLTAEYNHGRDGPAAGCTSCPTQIAARQVGDASDTRVRAPSRAKPGGLTWWAAALAAARAHEQR